MSDVQDVYGILGDEDNCGFCPREATGKRYQAIDYPEDEKRYFKAYLCQYCIEAFNFGDGKQPTVHRDNFSKDL